MIHNQPRSPLTGQIRPNPLQEDAQTEARCRQELEVHGRPREPSHDAAYTELAALQHSKTLAHHGHVPFIEIAKWAWRAIAGNAAVNQSPCIAPLLNRHLCNTCQWLAVLIERCGIANHKDLGMAGHSQILLDAYPTGAVCLRAQLLACWRGRHTRGPDHGFAQNTLPRHRDPVRVDLIDALPEPNLDAQFLELLFRGLGKVL